MNMKKNIYICIAESLYCIAEIKHSMYINYITAVGDCSHEIKRCLLLGRKIMIKLDQIRSVAQSCLTLCDPRNCSTPGLPVHHQLPEFTQTPVHRVSDAIQPSHPLSSPSPPAPNSFQHQSLFQ